MCAGTLASVKNVKSLAVERPGGNGGLGGLAPTAASVTVSPMPGLLSSPLVLLAIAVTGLVSGVNAPGSDRRMDAILGGADGLGGTASFGAKVPVDDGALVH